MGNKSKTLYIKSGLGNQLFQYSYALYLMKKGFSVSFDKTFYTSNTNLNKNVSTRKFCLDKFNINKNIQINQNNNLLGYRVNRILSKLISKKKDYFIDKKYHKDVTQELLEDINLVNETKNYKELKNKIGDKSLSIHIRRGDFVNLNIVLDLNYYKKSINLILKETKINQIYIFSDDSPWARNNLSLPDNVDIIYVSDHKLEDYEELILMSKCSHNIIANSTFSWWASFLNQNQNKMVIYPKNIEVEVESENKFSI